MTYEVDGGHTPRCGAVLWAACRTPAILSLLLAVFVVGVTEQPRAVLLVLVIFLFSSLANLAVRQNASH
jgi:hypothetical protein